MSARIWGEGGDSWWMHEATCDETKILRWKENSKRGRHYWNDYRIGDGLRRLSDAPGCARYPDTLVCAYARRTSAVMSNIHQVNVSVILDIFIVGM